MRVLSLLLCAVFCAASTVADERKQSPRETFVKYFQAMDARHSDVAHPFTILSTVLDREEVIYAERFKQNGAWRIQKLSRTSPENASWLMKGFQIPPDVKLDLSTAALVGEWWYPCDSTIVLNADGTGSDLEVGPGPDPDQQPERFTWTVNGSTLIRRFANREEQLVVSSVDHEEVDFETPNKTNHSGWRRRAPVTVIADAIVDARFRSAIKKPTGELTQADLEKEFWRLDFRFAPIADEGLREVFKIKQVKDILFNRTARITDAGLEEVAKLRHLEGLSLMETQITDAALQELGKLRNIDGLSLQNTKVTSAGLTELIELDTDQYNGRYLTNVQRKGKTITPKIFLVKAVRGYLDDYIKQERGDEPGPLFFTRTGKRFSIQQVDYVLKKLAGQANATLPAKEHIDAHPHILRHTMLRKVREKKGVEYAIEYAGHVSEQYIRRYTLPSEEETESALEELFG